MSGVCCLALVTDAFGGRGGIAQYNRDFLSALAKCGEGVAVKVAPRHAPDRVETPAGIDQGPPRARRVSYTIMALLTALPRRVDIVFCGHLYMAPLAWLVARLKRAKLVIQTHGVEAWPRPSRLRCAAVEAADLVLSVSRHTRAAVLSWARIAPERVLVLSNTVGEVFTPGDGSAMRAVLGLEGKSVLLTVGRIDARERYKGHDAVIDRIPHLLSCGHDLVYAIVGEGDDRARLEERARQKGVADRVCFLGALARPDLVLAYRLADLFLMPSTGEGFGITYLEAMASGTPALGLAVAGARDALGDGELGAAVSADELAAAIKRLLAAPKADPQALAQAVRARFGRAAFDARVAMALDRVLTRA